MMPARTRKAYELSLRKGQVTMTTLETNLIDICHPTKALRRVVFVAPTCVAIDCLTSYPHVKGEVCGDEATHVVNDSPYCFAHACAEERDTGAERHKISHSLPVAAE